VTAQRLVDAILDGATTEEAILAAVTEFGITRREFTELDERPGQFDGPRDYKAWHMYLRRVRNNPDNNLFDRLR